MRFAVIDLATGLISSVITTDSYEDGLELHGVLYKHLEEIPDADTILDTWHWDFEKNSFGLHEKRPDTFFIWDILVKRWKMSEEYLINIHKEGVGQINMRAGQKILTKYPIPYQLNAPYDFGQDSAEVQTMRIWIDNIRNLAKTAKTNIETSTTLAQINLIVENFKTELGNIA